MKNIKLIVVAMGVLIAVGLGFVIYGILRTTNSSHSSDNAPPYSVTLQIPEGSHLRSVSSDPHHIILHLTVRNDQEQVVVVDTATGKWTGQVTLQVAPH